MFNPFSYLRRLAAESIVNGVSDGIRAVIPDAEEADLEALRGRMADAVGRTLPAANGEPVSGASGEPSPLATPAKRARAKS